MPKRTSLDICSSPYQYKNKSLRMKKSYTAPDFKSGTILTDDVFTYIEFYFSGYKKAMKYRGSASKSTYGNELSTITVARKQKGAFLLFGKMIDPNFKATWQKCTESAK